MGNFKIIISPGSSSLFLSSSHGFCSRLLKLCCPLTFCNSLFKFRFYSSNFSYFCLYYSKSAWSFVNLFSISTLLLFYGLLCESISINFDAETLLIDLPYEWSSIFIIESYYSQYFGSDSSIFFRAILIFWFINCSYFKNWFLTLNPFQHFWIVSATFVNFLKSSYVCSPFKNLLRALPSLLCSNSYSSCSILSSYKTL